MDFNISKNKQRNKKIYTNFYNSSSKKPGFTLIEIIAVIAIIGILSAAILPKVNGYIKEAKKVKVVDQCRKVVMAVESYDLKQHSSLKQDVIVDNAMKNKGVNKYLEGVKLDNIDITSTSLKNCYDIVNGAEFDFVENTDVLNPTTITQITKNLS